MESGKRVYEFELWNIAGVAMADISAIAKNRKFTLERNEAELLSFTIDLQDFEDFCSDISAAPRTLLAPYQTEIKVKRNGQYLFGTQVVDCPIVINNTGAVINVSCTGYLNLFKDRYITKSYTQWEATAIAADMLVTTQAQDVGSVGVTIDSNLYVTGVKRDRNYTRDNIKSMLQNLTNLVDGNFDFKFDANKVFYIYQQLGGIRRTTALAYPGNVKEITVERTGTRLFNRIIGIGSGFGEDQVVSIKNDIESQAAYYLREGIQQFNSVVEQTTLDQNTQGALDSMSSLLEIPKVTVTGNEIDLNVVGVGDRLPVRVVNHAFLDNISGLYRTEKMEVTLDDNDFEESIVLYFDNYGVNQNEQ